MKRKSLLYRQLLSYVPAFFIVMTFIFFVFFQILGEQTRKEAIKANESLLLHALRTTDDSLKKIDEALVAELLNNPDLSSFFDDGRKDDVVLNMKVIRALTQLKVSNPSVDSLYLVRTRDHFALSAAIASELQDYPDYAFIEPYLEVGNDLAGWTGIRTFQEFSFNGAEPVVSLVRKAPFVTDGKGFVVVNVSVETMAGRLKSIYDPEVSFLRIHDGNRSPMVDVFDPKSGGEKVFSTLTSPYTGWVYESGLVNGKMVSVVNQLYNAWFWIGLVMIAAGLYWIVFVTRRNYKPVEQIVSRIQAFTQTKTNALLHGNNDDEFAFIETAIESLLEQSNQYRQRHHADLPMKKAYLFQQLLEGQFPIDMEQWEALELPDLEKRHVVSIVGIDSYAQFCNRFSQRDQNLLKFALRSVIHEMAQQHGTEVWTEWLFPDKLGMLSSAEAGPEFQWLQATALLEQARIWVEAHLKLTISAGVGGIASAYSLIPDSYEQAREALNYNMILGDNRVIAYDQVAKQDKGNAFDYLHLIHSTAQSFRLMNDRWREQFETVLRTIERDMLSNDQILNLADYLIYCLGRELSLMNAEVQELWGREGEPALKAALSQSDTFDRMATRFGQALDSIYGQLSDMSTRRSHAATIHNIRSYLESNFANPDVSLEHVSDRFDLNWKSLSKMFKEETGHKFVDYLIGLRIVRARKLLAETNLPIQDVAAEVGYTNAISFGRMFKRVVGMTPGEYRERADRTGEE
ncbi:helix-turn-helix domain-containing protein [Paenibacillus sp.]|uniref:helix-turn-helix domain-containing protein n=1 Tax=Paenibacillus sp. TaxID=58172 RepID=UPI002810D3A4|nr:helix-turn-helix domain-containing protein [Paenibacillus sp.]